MKKVFESPVITTIVFDDQDIIRTSPEIVGPMDAWKTIDDEE